MNDNDINTTFLTTDEVCKVLHISKLTLYRWVKQGKLTAIKVGKKLLIEQAELQRIISEGKTK